ncbi:Transcription factor bHLH30 [Ananas comosus]|nr:Transcription factor bHLH30 [Ananas comosus]
MSIFGSLHAEFGKMSAKEIMDAKALAASKSHSEAERRRRQRINGHLAKLRSLLPNTTKTDKASLLAEVIEHVKELKRQTTAITAEGGTLLLPTEADELTVDAAGSDEDGRLVVRASLCCDDRSDLIPDLARALKSLKLRARRAEIATLGGRVKNVFIITAHDDACHSDCVASIQETLRAVMDKKTATSDTSSSSSGIKRQRTNRVDEQQGSI